MIYTFQYSSPLGGITMACTSNGLVGLWFDGQRYFGQYGQGKAISCSDSVGVSSEASKQVYQLTCQWFDCYFQGLNPGALPPLSLEGSPFRLTVWAVLQTIPYGQTVTYGYVAREVAHRQGRNTWSAQAAGGAIGQNPISIIIPCHRVVGTNGDLTGYAGGIEIKRRLLMLESGNPLA